MVDATTQVTDQPNAIAGFVDLLRLDDIDVNLFRGWCHAGAPLRAFGGQVAAQALVAAGRTVGPGRLVHSLHGYFMRPGDPRRPLVYEVERLRDGRSYATRRVTAIQRGEAMFTLSASFKVPEESPDRQRSVPLLPDPELLPDPYADWADAGSDGGNAAGPKGGGSGDYWTTTGRLTLDMRTVPHGSEALPDRQAGVEEQFVWLKSASPLPGDDPLLHVCALAYLSDLTLASTAAMHLQPPRSEHHQPGLAGPRDVVPPAVPGGRVAAVRPAQPERGGRTRAGPGRVLHPGRPTGRLGGPGGPGPAAPPLTARRRTELTNRTDERSR